MQVRAARGERGNGDELRQVDGSSRHGVSSLRTLRRPGSSRPAARL
jgi:hypothetical protein